MSANTKIEWADHTFNPWVGCTKVSPACDHCYAEGWAKRAGTPELWQGERRRTTEANWKQPLKWNQRHDEFFAEHGRRQRVFCASLADVFDNQVSASWRMDLWSLIAQTTNLDWLLLTKRPQNIRKMLPPDWSNGWSNVWLGTTVENQKEFERRYGHLANIPAVVRFLSMEPLLGAVNISMYTDRFEMVPGLHWVITGGESGPKARPLHPDWARSLRDQCQAAGVAFFFKQWGEWCPGFIEDGYELEADITGLKQHDFGGFMWVYRAGKKAAGRLLDGREWNEFPEVQA